MLFCPEQYWEALGSQGAYGNELSSFFVSNLEYDSYINYFAEPTAESMACSMIDLYDHDEAAAEKAVLAW